MEIYILGKDCLRLKGKQATLIVDPDPLLKTKPPADAVILTKKEGDFDASAILGQRLTILGPGEYEIGRIKISSLLLGEDLVHTVLIDGIKALLIRAETLEKSGQKIKESALECQVLVLNADGLSDGSLITELTPRVVVVYGEKADEVAKSLGKQVQAVNKFSIVADKLPEEMEVVVLG